MKDYEENKMKTTLLIMAAGIGSRFGGGIKQLASVDDYNHIIMDYSIHDAIEAGFNKIVFIIRKDIESDFKMIIGDRIEAVCAAHHVEVGYCFQDINDIPAVEPYNGVIPEGRTKPWGTGQAVLAAKALVDSPFAVINADDYYGKEAFRQLHDWLVLEHADNAISMAGFILKNTLSDNGGVTRGVCKVNQGHTHITDVIETSNIVKTPDGPEADGVKLDPDSYVSMNMWGFPAKPGQTPPFMNVLEDNFITFFKETVPSNPLKAEYLLPILIGGLLREGDYSVKVLPTNDKWFGVTYAEDKEAVIASFKELIENGTYKPDLFTDL